MVLGGDDTAYIEKAKKSDWEQLIVLDQVEPNKMKAYNAVLDHSELGHILVFSDMDCEFPENFVELYLEAFTNKEKNIVTGRVRPDPHSERYIDRYHRNFEKMTVPGTLKTDISIVGSNFAVRKKFFLTHYKRFDESIVIGTDKAISRRFKTMGEPVYFDPRIIVYTQFFSGNYTRYIRQQTRWVRIRLLANRKSNPKAYRKSLVTLLFAWLMAAILPLSIFLSNPLISNEILPIWYGALLLWMTLLVKAWLKRVAIFRCGKGTLFNDLIGALAMLAIHCGIQILASLQLISKKHKYRW
jgi:hypothetical protein